MEVTIHRDPFLPGLYEVTYWQDNGNPSLFGLQHPRDILKALHNHHLCIHHVHFTRGNRPNKTYRRPTPASPDAANAAQVS